MQQLWKKYMNICPNIKSYFIKGKLPNQNNDKDILIIRLTETSFLAVTSICSHQGCSVQPPDSEYTNIYCACHGAEFNPESGKVVKQPTSGSATSLTSFPVKYNSVTNIITITF